MSKEMSEVYNDKRETENDVDKIVDGICEEIRAGFIHALHKTGRYNTPDSKLGDLDIDVAEFCKMSDTERMEDIISKVPTCYGMHNGRLVLNFKGYFVGLTPECLAKKFHALMYDSKGNARPRNLNNMEIEQVAVACANYGNYIQEEIKNKLGLEEYDVNYIFFNKRESAIENNNIYKMIKTFYNDTLQGIDLRTNTPLAESYFKLVGWVFSPFEIKRRIVGCFECKTSGIGKTAFINMLCKRTNVVCEYMSRPNGTANSFSFSSAFANGPDVICVDDPCNGCDEILKKITDVVSNNRTDVELKNKNVYTLQDLHTKFYISCNEPLYMKRDTNNFMSRKLFVLKANDVPVDETTASKIAGYIDRCDIKEIEEFLTYCVDLYQENSDEFINSHLGLYVDEETATNMFEDAFDYTRILNATLGCTTLIECVKDDMCRNERDHEHNDNVLKLWNKITKFIQTQLPDIARETVCSVSVNNNIYAIGSRPSKSRYKNFIVTKELQQALLTYIKEKEQGNDVSECSTISMDVLDELYHL